MVVYPPLTYNKQIHLKRFKVVLLSWLFFIIWFGLKSLFLLLRSEDVQLPNRGSDGAFMVRNAAAAGVFACSLHSNEVDHMDPQQRGEACLTGPRFSPPPPPPAAGVKTLETFLLRGEASV